jgi:hypothetical protein
MTKDDLLCLTRRNLNLRGVGGDQGQRSLLTMFNADLCLGLFFFHAFIYFILLGGGGGGGVCIDKAPPPPPLTSCEQRLIFIGKS